MREGNCRCIVVYDWGEERPLQALVEQLVMLFEDAVGRPPDRCSVLEGASTDSIVVGLEELQERVAVRAGSIAAVQIYETLPDHSQLVFGWSTLGAVFCDLGKTGMFCFDSRSKAEKTKAYATALVRACNPGYGIVYDRDYSLGPEAYALGMAAGLDYSGEGMREADSISAWFHERLSGRNRHLVGLHRDLYPGSILGKRHLSLEIEPGVTFRSWVEARPSRGALSALAQDVWYWEVPATERAHLKHRMREAGLIICP